eukprot:COSAG05_NODE_2393_length_3124_cov_5.020489_3_plen_158_part_00
MAEDGSPVRVVTTLLGFPHWDHVQVLGDTLTLIAGEKAGIFKQGVPDCHSGPASRTALEKHAGTKGTPLIVALDGVLWEVGWPHRLRGCRQRRRWRRGPDGVGVVLWGGEGADRAADGVAQQHCSGGGWGDGSIRRRAFRGEQLSPLALRGGGRGRT